MAQRGERLAAVGFCLHRALPAPSSHGGFYLGGGEGGGLSASTALVSKCLTLFTTFVRRYGSSGSLRGGMGGLLYA